MRALSQRWPDDLDALTLYADSLMLPTRWHWYDRDGQPALQHRLGDLVRGDTVLAYPDEPLRMVVYRMAEKGFTRMPVVDRATHKFLGLISLDDLLKARSRHLEEERRRERTLQLRFLLPGGKTSKETETTVAS